MDHLVALAGFVEKFKNPAELASLWQGVEEHLRFDDEETESTIGTVERQALALLRGDKIVQRASGVVLLASMTRVCSPKHFVPRCLVWVRHLISSLQTGNSYTAGQGAVVHLLSQLLQRASQFSQLSSEISNSIPGLITSLLKAEKELLPDALECLTTCMQSFPGACSSMKAQILKSLLPLLDVGGEKLQDGVARCLASLPYCSAGGGQVSGRHAEVWLDLCNQLVATLNDALDMVFSPIEKVATPLLLPVAPQNGAGPKVEKLDLVEPGLGEPTRTAQLLIRCQSLAQCISALLQTAYPVAVSFPLQAILALACRMLSVTSQQLNSHPSLECVLLFTALPSFYCSAIHLLTAITFSCKSFLLPQSWLINQLILQVLDWTQGEKNDDQFSPYSTVRCSAHQLLEAWLWVLGAGLDSSIALRLVQHMLRDARSVRQPSAVDTMLSTDAKQGGQKRKKMKEGQPDVLVGEKDTDYAVNSELCQAALKALAALLLASGASLGTECLKVIQLFVLPLLLECQQSRLALSNISSPRGWWGQDTQTPAPYGCPDCRSALYRVLLCCILVDNHLLAAPLHHAIGVFSTGLQDPNMQVSIFCRQALATCNLLLHPRVPSLQVSQGEPLMVAPPFSAPPTSQATTSDPATVENLRQQYLVLAQQQQHQQQQAQQVSGSESCTSSGVMAVPAGLPGTEIYPGVMAHLLHRGPMPVVCAPTVANISMTMSPPLASSGTASALLLRRQRKRLSSATSTNSEEGRNSEGKDDGLLSKEKLRDRRQRQPRAKRRKESESVATPVQNTAPSNSAETITQMEANQKESTSGTAQDKCSSAVVEGATTAKPGESVTSVPELQNQQSPNSDKAPSSQGPLTRGRSKQAEVSSPTAKDLLTTFVDTGPDTESSS